MMGLLNFHSADKILLAFHLKHASFWPLANVKLTSNYIAHAMSWQCIFAPSISSIEEEYHWVGMQYCSNTAEALYNTGRIS